jgi:Peptidase M50B-like
MESFMDALNQAWQHLAATTPIPDPRAFASAVLAGMLTVLWSPTWLAARRLSTIAHEGGHALAAFVTRRNVLRVHVNADGSGTTHYLGSTSGFGAALVTFAGYPFPAIAGTGLLLAAVSGGGRQWAAVTALALVMLWWRTRNLHGWVLIGICLGGLTAAAWYLPGGVLALALAWLGAFLLAAALRDLLDERRGRRAGASDSDVANLARRGRFPSGFWWSAMTAIVIGCGWIAWEQLTGAYAVL